MLDKHIYDAIEEEAIAWAADLIVIGTHGRKGVRQRLALRGFEQAGIAYSRSMKGAVPQAA